MIRSILTLSILSLSIPAWAAAQDNPFIGVWRVNYAISSPPPAGLIPRPRTITREAYGEDGERMTSRATGKGGRVITSMYAAQYDGKDYPYEGRPDRDTVSIVRVDSHRTISTYKKAGKVVVVQTRVVSADGRRMYAVGRPSNAQGQEILNITVWEKQ